MADKILAHLSPDHPWADRILWLDSTDSTNDQLRAIARKGAPHGTVIVAGHQSAGHGRRGRSFQSPEGMGVYMSVLLRPDCAPTELMHLTCAAGVAMCDAVENLCGMRPGIKWTNDLVWEKHKLGGILTELGFTAQGSLDYAIVGVGINCSQGPDDFPQEIRQIAASLHMVTGSKTDRFQLAAAMIDAFQKMDLTRKTEILKQYRQDCITIGQDISLVRGDETRYGKALDVDEEGALVVVFSDGSVQSVNSGEVSVRGMYGYI